MIAMTTLEATRLFEEHFLSSLSLSEKKEIYLDCFLWHAFSYEKLPCLTGQEARDAFHRVSGDEVFLFFEGTIKDTPVLKARSLAEKEIERLREAYSQDLYVVDQRFRWAYIRTHEEDWEELGPYFYAPGESLCSR